MTTAETVIIGGGIVGASTAHYLARKGLTGVTLLEREAIASGATGRTGGLVRMHYTNRPETEMALWSRGVFQHWGELIGDESGFRQTGFVFVVGPQDVEGLMRNVAMQQGVGVRQEVLSPAELKTLLPAWAAADVGAATYEPESGHADGHAAANSMARGAADLGVTVRQGVTVTRIVVRTDKVMGVETAAGVIQTRTVVLAAGAWSAALARTAGVEVPLDVMLLAVGVLERPPSLSVLHPACIDTIQGIYFRPEGDNLTLLGDSRFEEPDDAFVDPNRYPPEPPEGWSADACVRMTRRVPAFADGLWRRTWIGVDGRTPDGCMMLGQAPGVEGLYLACGMNGHGFKTGPAVGLAMAELILDGHATTVDIRPFRPSRFAEGQPIKPLYEYSSPYRGVRPPQSEARGSDGPD